MQEYENCSEQCFLELDSILSYTDKEIVQIEFATRGQAANENWHNFKQGCLTASTFHSICNTRDSLEKVVSLLKGSTLNEDLLPADIQFGRLFEEKARKLFMSCHHFTHRNYSVLTPGIIFSKEMPFLACSSDGIVSCDTCGKFLIEIKCMSKHRNSHARLAAEKMKLITKDESGNFSINKSHKYYSQILGQMAITEINKCVLVVYTHNGIYTVEVSQDEEEWNKLKADLVGFFRQSFFLVLRANAQVCFTDK